MEDKVLYVSNSEFEEGVLTIAGSDVAPDKSPKWANGDIVITHKFKIPIAFIRMMHCTRNNIHMAVEGGLHQDLVFASDADALEFNDKFSVALMEFYAPEPAYDDLDEPGDS